MLTADVIFKIAGFAMGTHVVSSILLFAILSNDPMTEELFALPNAWLGTRPRLLSFRLMRGKYFLPWVASPNSMAQQPFAVRVVFWVARLAGAIFPCVMIAFFAALFIQSEQ